MTALFAQSTKPNQPGTSACLGLLTSLFALTAFCLLWFGAIGCDFIKFTDVSGTSQPISRSFGLWYYQFWATITSTDGTYIVKTCQVYPDAVALDGSWKAALAFSIITFILVLVMLIGKCCLMCNSPLTEVSTKCDAPMYLLIALCQGLTLLFLNSKVCKANPIVDFGEIVWQDTCSISVGAKCTISAIVFWAAAALTSFQEQKALESERAAGIDASMAEPLAPEEA